METVPPPPRPAGSAAVACVSCRRLKMRCIGADNPPCARCAKAHRECIVRPHQRHQIGPSLRRRKRSHRGDAVRTTDQPFAAVDTTPDMGISIDNPGPISTTDDLTTSTSPMSVWGDCRLDFYRLMVSEIPSIFSTSALSIATEGMQDLGKGHDTSLFLSDDFSLSRDEHYLDMESIPREVLIDLITIFRHNFLQYVPVIPSVDVENIVDLIDKKPSLAYSMAFVASRLIPGCISVHRKLVPYIVQLCQGRLEACEQSEANNWICLQALSVIYAYLQVPAMTGSSFGSMLNSKEYLSHGALKSTVEAMAMQLQLHRSIDELQTMMQINESSIWSTETYHRCVYWVWLYIMSRHYSVLTRTPPSIQNDSTMRRSLIVLKALNPGSHVRQILAEAELYAIWDQAALSSNGLAEWWCSPVFPSNLETEIACMQRIDVMLDAWHSTWLSGVPETDSAGLEPAASLIVEFLYHLVRFHIHSFASVLASYQVIPKSPCAPWSTGASEQQLPALAGSIIKSADAACGLCDLLIRLKPSELECVRYIPEFGFTMITLCCLYIIHAYEVLSGYPLLMNHMSKVEKTSKLMTEIALGPNQLSKLYGEFVMSRLQRAMEETPSLTGGSTSQVMYANGNGPSEVETSNYSVNGFWPADYSDTTGLDVMENMLLHVPFFPGINSQSQEGGDAAIYPI